MAAMSPKKSIKRKRPLGVKEAQSPPISPDGPKIAPLKFYQDTLEEKANKEGENATENDEDIDEKHTKSTNKSLDKDDNLDDDTPLKKVKEDIEKKVRAAKGEAVDDEANNVENKNNDSDNAEDTAEAEPKKPGPGCGPNGPPGVLTLHRRKGPKKKLSWRPQEELEQIRYFEIDETERVNVTKTTSFLDMKNMERFKERDAIHNARRGFINEDNMEVQTTWRDLIEVEDVPPHPYGNLSKQRKIQEERESSTLRALYFSHIMIPDSPAEAELEPHYSHDVPIIPLDDVTGNPDAVNNYTNMPWPEPKGSPKHDDNAHSGTGGLVGTDELFLNALPTSKDSPFGTLPNSFGSSNMHNTPTQNQMHMQMPGNANAGINNWPLNARPFGANGPMMNNQYNTHMGNAPQNFMGAQQFGPMNGGGMPFGNNGPQFGGFGPNGPNMRSMGPNGLMNGVVNAGPHMLNGPPMLMGMNSGPGPRNNNRNNMQGNWQNNGNMGNNNGPWRSAGPGPLRGPNNGNNGICKAFMRGQCRLGKSCKYIHPVKHNSKRL